MKEFNLTSVCNSRGFTLLEILIAIVLLAFVVMGVVNITENAFQTKERTTQINQNNLQIETAMSRFEWDFSQIYSPLYFSPLLNLNQNLNNPGDNSELEGGDGQTTGGDPGGQASGASPYAQQYLEQMNVRFQQNEHFQNLSKDGIPVPRFYAPEKSVFEFLTTSNRRKIENTKQSHFAWVRYQLTEQTQTKEEEEDNKFPKSLKSLARYYTADDPYNNKRIDIEDAERVKGAVLLRNVESLEFQFWDFERRKWENSLTNIQQGEALIRGVKIIITWYDSYGSKRTNTRIFRNPWPLVVPQDQNGATAAGVTGTPGGGETGLTTGGR